MICSFKPKLGKKAEVQVSGSTYRGILKSITETEIILKGETKTWSLPLSSVKRVTYVEDPKNSANTFSPTIDRHSAFDQKTDPYGETDS